MNNQVSIWTDWCQQHADAQEIEFTVVTLAFIQTSIRAANYDQVQKNFRNLWMFSSFKTNNFIKDLTDW